MALFPPIFYHTPRSAHLTHQVRSDRSEKAIEAAIETLKQTGKPISKAAVARIVGLRREHISRRYGHCFPSKEIMVKKRRVQPVSGQFVLSAPDGRWEENEKGELAFKHTHTVYFESSVGVGKAKYWADDIEKAQVFTNMDEAVAMLLEVNRAHSPVSIQSLQEVPESFLNLAVSFCEWSRLEEL
ncbi:hypothetical protein [Vibrio sp. TBV020]|uniref:hypothetical protein n=1 Tax=Vibrio sp. TBV020 TaxID=3137398 RepID=UPI0038CDB1B1